MVFGAIYDLIAAAVRTADRGLLLGYVHDLARKRLENGFSPAEVCDALLAIDEIIIEQLLYKPEVAPFEQNLRDGVTLSIALAIDGVQDAYQEAPAGGPLDDPETDDQGDLEAIVAKLNGFYHPAGATTSDRPKGADR